MNKYLFYPGCSLQRNASAYLDSTIAIRDDINIVLEEVQDWNCCGATPAATVHPMLPHALAARNLAIAEEMGMVLRRTSYSPNIKERLDFSCALFDASGQMIAQAAHIPVHLGAMPISVYRIPE